MRPPVPVKLTPRRINSCATYYHTLARLVVAWPIGCRYDLLIAKAATNNPAPKLR
ncbi:hypothetical protein EDWATA_01866 [Edwardsiella tarda ATCC 23685]|uniref:Uncharacterized protein n=1 Tax=Edwardsiella tarda ATCC 23685 TaxID=500638 RepID=D4F538_EDWTA|nr:hypothetical protein EDWATA_01866 [Edwardsiella tarda ATCC 23685]BEH72569.1 hypothetical protein GBS0709_16860 [Edwardsiella tarda]GAC63405.1 hypothetical protein ET1_05_00910 [Edwardsiella tarda ATCC 15947 = NBRC 105688]